jgi:hypothetical protein
MFPQATGAGKKGRSWSAPVAGPGIGLIFFWLTQNDAVAERQGIKLDRHTDAFGVRENSTDFGPDGLFAVAAFFDAVGDERRLDIAHDSSFLF